jgi:hypothetical protein
MTPPVPNAFKLPDRSQAHDMIGMLLHLERHGTKATVPNSLGTY